VSELLARLAAWPVGSSLELSQPWSLLLLAVPALAFTLLPAYRQRQPVLRVPFPEPMAEGLARKPEPRAVVLRQVALRWLLAPLVFVLLVAAAARPELVLAPIQKTEAARDLLLAVDISQSMDTPDFADARGRRLQRLDALKAVLRDFIARRAGDRVGLLVFGDAPQLQAPFTLDHELCGRLLDEVRVGMAGPRTRLGDAVGLAIKLFDESRAKRKVLVLLAAGNDTGSRVPPGKAADIARSRGITIHTVGIGDPASRGAELVDAGTLKAVAQATGGASFLALSHEELEGIQRRLDQIEKTDVQIATYRPRRPLFHWPLGAAALLSLAFLVVLTGVGDLQRLRSR
jgi:Ca-activated chloride channel family protein